MCCWTTQPYLVFGDIHFNKIFQKGIIHSDKPFSILRNQYIIKYLVFNLRKFSNIKHIVFLGDVFDTGIDDFNYYKFFKQMIQQFPDRNFHVVWGNHDRKYMIKYITECTYYLQPNLCYKDNILTLFLPHVGDNVLTIKNTIANLVHKAKQFQSNIQSVIILSHNYIYLVSSYANQPTVVYNDIVSYIKRELHAENVIVLNGHIHRYSIEGDFVQLGSVCPMTHRTSYTTSVNMAYFDPSTCTYRVYRNNFLHYLSLDNEIYKEKCLNYVKLCQTKQQAIFLKIPQSMVDFGKSLMSRYKCIIGIKIY